MNIANADLSAGNPQTARHCRGKNEGKEVRACSLELQDAAMVGTGKKAKWQLNGKLVTVNTTSYSFLPQSGVINVFS